MGSPAYSRYEEVAKSARVMRFASGAGGTVVGTRDEQRRLYQGALAASIASWDAYLNQVVRDFFDATAPKLSPNLLPIHQIAQQLAERMLGRFNTPNSQNSREVLLSATGYDPWPDWNWPVGRMTSLDVRNRLDEIVKVRHSFAHGFTMPRYGWNQTRLGVTRLDAHAVDSTLKMVAFLVSRTDFGLHLHIEQTFGVRSLWY